MPETDRPDPVAAYLTNVHERWDTAENAVYATLLGRAQALTALADIPRLLSAVEAVRALADDWAATQGDGPGYIAVRACGIRVRSVIAAELLKEG